MENKRYIQWKNANNLSSDLRKQLDRMLDVEIEDAFTSEVEFGTAGMRGVLGPGPNRINEYTIRKASYGFAKYLSDNKNKLGNKVAIGYDNRHYSKQFAYETAKVMASFDLEVFVYPELRSTPQLSFAIRYLNCAGGVMITASHNPREYNGYKVYDHTGCQLLPEPVERIVKYFQEIENELDYAVELSDSQQNLIKEIGHEVDEEYYKEIMNISINPELDKANFNIAYSSQHGTGLTPITEVFKRTGYSLEYVESQSSFDPDFSNTKSANPEELAAYDELIMLGKKHEADLIITTDPDADRIGVGIRHDEEYVILNGDKIGALLLEYMLSNLDDTVQKNKLFVVNTVVSSDFIKNLLSDYGVQLMQTLTGFKYIGNLIEHYSKTKEKNFFFGYEESHGYLINSFVRDKDGIQACFMLAEAALYYKHKGLTLIDVLESLSKKHGYYLERQVSVSLKGSDGPSKLKSIMKLFREEIFTDLGKYIINKKEDYLLQEVIIKGSRSKLEYDRTNMIKLYINEGWIAIRPSGTEPKLKIYYCLSSTSQKDATDLFIDVQNTINQLIG